MVQDWMGARWGSELPLNGNCEWVNALAGSLMTCMGGFYCPVGVAHCTITATAWKLYIDDCVSWEYGRLHAVVAVFPSGTAWGSPCVTWQMHILVIGSRAWPFLLSLPLTPFVCLFVCWCVCVCVRGPLSLSLSSPWYNRNGWLAVKHQVTYSLSRTSLCVASR